jgi:DNA repair protein SbcD/Mre11
VRFVHAADLHLDSPFRGLGQISPVVAERLRDASFATLDRLARHARAADVDCLLLAGDTYDGADRSVRAQVRLRDCLAGLARDGIESLMVLGNHDPADGWSLSLDMPGVHVFPAGEPGGHDVVVEGRRLGHVDGISYPTREVRDNYALRLRRRDDAPASVALLHANVQGGITSESDYAPARLADLVASGHDYWALGHVHTRQILRPERPAVVYPGNMQGRSMRETGERGAYEVEVADGVVHQLTFVPLCQVVFALEPVDVGVAAGSGDVTDLLLDRLAALRAASGGQPRVVRLVLSGEANAGVRDLMGDPARRRDLLALLQERAEAEIADALVWPEGLVDATERPLRAPLPGTLLADVLDLAERAAADGADGEALRREARAVLGPLIDQPGLTFLATQAGDEALRAWLAAAAERLFRALGDEAQG